MSHGRLFTVRRRIDLALIANQSAFLANAKFFLNQRADYYTYCFYQSLQFLKPDGQLGAVTSNAWLGKNYGLQLKRFLLDNFHIRYVVKSEAEHWFENAQVSTVYVVVQRESRPHHRPTRFVTLRQPLEHFRADTPAGIIGQVAAFYDAVDTCDGAGAAAWQPDPAYSGSAYEHRHGLARVSVVPQARLAAMRTSEENWESLFVAPDVLSPFAARLINPTGTVFQNGRGTRTGQDKFFILSAAEALAAGIEDDFLQPLVRSSRELTSLHHTAAPTGYSFICTQDEATLAADYPGAYRWVKKWEQARNEKGKLLPQVLRANQPHWYSLRAEAPASIFISINPDKKLFFSYTDQPVQLNQRLVAIRPVAAADTALVAALLNSVVTLLIVELNGTARNLGALDLNADFFKSRVRLLDPSGLTAAQRQAVLKAFARLSGRTVRGYTTEFAQPDRRRFDEAVFTAFGFPLTLLDPLYKMLTDLMENRVTRKDK